MPKMNLSQKIKNEIDQARSILIASHLNPEGDAIGSSLALYHQWKGKGKKIQVFNNDFVPYFLAFLPGAKLIINQLGLLARNFDLALVVDCANLSRVNDKFPEFLRAKKIINIDHHETNDKFGDINLVEPKSSSAGEIIFNLLKATRMKINKNAATCLYTAISTDTGSFQYLNTTVNSLRSATELVRLGANPSQIARNAFHNHPANRLILLSQVLQTLQFSADKKRADLTLTREMFEKAEAGPEMAEGFINFLTSLRGLEVAVLFREQAKNEFKVTFRSQGKINVAELAAGFGGGGHRQASGATLSGELARIKEQVRAQVDSLIEKISHGR